MLTAGRNTGKPFCIVEDGSSPFLQERELTGVDRGGSSNRGYAGAFQ